jgi:membrane protein DedA with SNARE-associated domain
MAIESSFIPFPSEIVIPPAAYLAAEGEMSFSLVLLFGTLGALIGATVNYFLAYYLGRPIIYAFVNSKLGRFFLLNEEKVKKSEAYFVKNGAISTFIGRLLPAIRQLISIPAGLAKMNFSKFILYTTLGAGLWNLVLAMIGYSLQRVVPRDQLMDKVHQYNTEISLIVVAIVALAAGYMLYNAFRKKKSVK